MIGCLPAALEISGRQYAIRSDFRVVLNIFQAFNDPQLTDREKLEVCLICLYPDLKSIPKKDLQEAADKAYWFVGGGGIPETPHSKSPVISWEHDEHIIYPAISKVMGVLDVRSVPYIHWWTFLGAFGEISDGLLSEVIHIRSKKSRGEKLDKTEREFYRNNKGLIDIPKHSKAEQAEIDKEKAALEAIL